MLKISILIWMMLGTVLAGVCIIVVLMVPGLAEHALRSIPVAAIVGLVIAIPISYFVARQIDGQRNAGRA